MLRKLSCIIFVSSILLFNSCKLDDDKAKISIGFSQSIANKNYATKFS